MLITHRELFVILINNSPVSSWLDCCRPTKTTASSTRREEIHRQGNTLFVNDSIKRSFINFYLNRRAKDRRERKKLTTSNRLTTSRCFMCVVIDIIRISTEYLRTSDLRCQVRDSTTTDSRLHAFGVKYEKAKSEWSKGAESWGCWQVL